MSCFILILYKTLQNKALDESVTWVFSTLFGGLFLPILVILMAQLFSGAYNPDNSTFSRDIKSIFVGGEILLFSVAIVMAVLTDFYLYNRRQKNYLANKVPRWWIVLTVAVLPITILVISSTFLAICFNKNVTDFLNRDNNCIYIDTLVLIQIVILTVSLFYVFVIKMFLSKKGICHQR